MLSLALLTPLHPAGADPGPPQAAPAMNWAPESGKLLATAGVTQIEGAGGGGLVPWSLITGYGTRDAIGGNAHYTYVHTGNFDLHTTGAAIGLYDRVEISFARQWFDTRQVGAKLGLGKNYMFDQNIVGAKVRLLGDAVYGQDSWLPQISVGAQYKSNNRSKLLSAIGARSADGVDFYLAATKLFLAESLLVNATVRATKANQFGLLGFGGDRNNGYRAQFEGSAAYLLNRNLAFGAEFRTKPDNLRFAREDNAWDIFAAWFINKNVSATLAYVDLGRIAGQHNQSGGLSFLASGVLVMPSRLIALAIAATVSCAPVAHADTLFDRLGAKPGLEKLVSTATTIFTTDPRISGTFEDTNLDRFKKMLFEQLCQLTDGGCSYTGHSMREAHKGLHLNTQSFNILVEDLQLAMERVQIPFATQNRLLALLAPMYRDVVSK